MQPVLSRAMRMLLGREHFDETELETLAKQIKADPSLMEPFADDDELDTHVATPLVAKDNLGLLIDALEGSGIRTKPISGAIVELTEPGLRIAMRPKGLTEDMLVTYLDGLNPTLRRFAHQLWRAGERMPLVLGTAEIGAFRSVHAAWVGSEGVKRIRNFAELLELVAAWNGTSPAVDDWLSAQRSVRAEARQQVEAMMKLAALRVATIRAQQVAAAKLRLQEELGRFLICAEPDTDDLNGKLHGMTQDRTATAERLRRVFHRLGGYPDWPVAKLLALRSLRDNMTANQIKTRLTGRELDAAMDDPRWAVLDGGQIEVAALH